jgi:hypothetical protein
MDFENSKEDPNSGNDGEQQQIPPSQAGRPPPLVLTNETNLIILQKQLRELLKGNFKFRNTGMEQNCYKGNGVFHSYQIIL